MLAGSPGIAQINIVTSNGTKNGKAIAKTTRTTGRIHQRSNVVPPLSYWTYFQESYSVQ